MNHHVLEITFLYDSIIEILLWGFNRSSEYVLKGSMEKNILVDNWFKILTVRKVEVLLMLN